MQLAPGLHRIGSDLVNSYLVIDDSGVTVIDAGLSGHYGQLVAELTSIGRTPADVRALLLTHGDTDHLGFAEQLRVEHGVPILAHELEVSRAKGQDPKPKVSWKPLRVGPMLRFLWYAARRGGLRTTYVGEVATFTGGQTLELPGSPRIVHVPGHTPGSVAIHVPAVEAVFVGDALTTGHVLTGEQGPQPAPFTLDPDGALASLEAIEHLDVRWVLPGHGAPWDGGVGEAVRRIREAATR